MTFAHRLAELVAAGGGHPLVTFYDQQSGERTELSRTTYANWVAKTASYLVEECDLERGDRIFLDLPPHWLGTVFLGAAWTAGLVVSSHGEPASAIVAGPSTFHDWATSVAQRPVIACALLPLAGRFSEPLPTGIRDFGADVWSQPDAFVAWDPPADDDLATDTATQRDLFAEATTPVTGARWVSTKNPVTDGLKAFADLVVRRDSLVLVRHPDANSFETLFASERATAWDQPIRS